MRINRLSARKVATITKPGRHSDGQNLYLSISKAGGRSWVFLYRWCGKPTEIGLGSARDVSLAQARALAAEKRALIAKNINPKGARAARAGATFGEVADRYIEAMKPKWRSSKHAAQWETTLKTYAASLRQMPVDVVDTAAVLAVLRPVWHATPETASRVRCRIERVLDAARAEGLRI